MWFCPFDRVKIWQSSQPGKIKMRNESAIEDKDGSREPCTAAQRALAEAAARRAESNKDMRPREVGGREGLDPIRYGDWEVKGIASDF